MYYIRLRAADVLGYEQSNALERLDICDLRENPGSIKDQ